MKQSISEMQLFHMFDGSIHGMDFADFVMRIFNLSTSCHLRTQWYEGERNEAKRAVDASHALKLDIFLVVANNSLRSLVKRSTYLPRFFFSSYV